MDRVKVKNGSAVEVGSAPVRPGHFSTNPTYHSLTANTANPRLVRFSASCASHCTRGRLGCTIGPWLANARASRSAASRFSWCSASRCRTRTRRKTLAVPSVSPLRASLRLPRSKPRGNREWFRRSIRRSLPKPPKRSLASAEGHAETVSPAMPFLAPETSRRCCIGLHRQTPDQKL
jgi:hypothetical protein